MNDGGDDTRELLKRFGVAVTDFLDRSAELLEQLEGSETPNGAVFGELLHLVRETNSQWEAVTAHLFSEQERVLMAAAKLLEARGG